MKQIRFTIIALLVLVFVVTACAPAAPAPAPAAEKPAAEAPAAEAPAAEAAPAGEFNWKAYEGETLNLLMVKHPFANTMEEDRKSVV